MWCGPTNTPSLASGAMCTARPRSTRAKRSIGAPCAFSAAVRLGITSPWNRRSATPASKNREISNERTGLVMGSGGPSTRAIVEAADIARSKGPKRVGPFAVPKAMSSTASATLATWFKIKGLSYSISSACATSNHCIGNAFELIQYGKQDMMFAGGCEELDWTLTVLFDAMGALSSKYNDTPAKASRAYDADRDGFVISAGAGVLVLEELEHAKARGARIYAELAGYGATSDGADMVAPSGEGAARCMRLALKDVKPPVDYINPHATRRRSAISRRSRRSAKCSARAKSARRSRATKSLTGHSQGATGVHEAIYSLLMMNSGFICESANIENLDPAFADMPILRERRDNVTLGCVLSNSFGFGGTNASHRVQAAGCVELCECAMGVMAGLRPGHPRLLSGEKSWMPATSAGMTGRVKIHARFDARQARSGDRGRQ